VLERLPLLNKDPLLPQQRWDQRDVTAVVNVTFALK